MPRNSTSTLAEPIVDPGPTEAATRIIERLLGGFDGSFALRLWNGVTHYYGPGAPDFTLVFHDPAQLAIYQWVHEGGKWHLDTLAGASE